MPEFEPVDPAPYSWWVPALGALLLIVVALWLIHVLRGRRSQTPQTAYQDVPRLRSGFGDRLDQVHTAFMRGEIDLRELHLQVAEIVRGFGSGRVGRDLTPMSRGEVAAFMPGSVLAELLQRCEQPSFSRDPAAEAEHTIGLAREVITSW